MSRTFTQDERTRMLAAIDRVVQLACPEAFTGDLCKPGGVGRIANHLDALVEIVRRTTATAAEPYLWQVLEDVCDYCDVQDPSCHCPLRHRNLCVLYKCVPGITQAIAAELIAMNDEAYLRLHPQWQ